MDETITLSKDELEKLIAEAVAKNVLPRKRKDFRDVHINCSDFEKINIKFPEVAHKLSRQFASQTTDLPSKDERRLGLCKPDKIYSRRRYSSGLDNYVHRKIYCSEIQVLLKSLSLSVMGVTLIKDLDDDEFEYSLHIYEKLKKCFLDLYEKRLFEEERILETIDKQKERKNNV